MIFKAIKGQVGVMFMCFMGFLLICLFYYITINFAILLREIIAVCSYQRLIQVQFYSQCRLLILYTQC